MNTIKTIISSRTAWTIVLMFAVSGIEGIREPLGAVYEPLMAVLSALAIYFKLNPSQRYSK
jgi:hypothetical protein